MNCKHCDATLTRADKNFGKIDECRKCAVDVDRYVGHMIWDHKTAPVIEIHANKASLHALKDGRYNEGLALVHEVKERSRRREGDDGSTSVSLQPYRHNRTQKKKPKARFVKPIEVRSGKGRTYTSFSAAQVSSARKDRKLKENLSAEKYEVLMRCVNLPYDVRQRKRIEVWQDENGLYVRPSRKQRDYGSPLDAQTLRSLGYRGANYTRS